LGVLVAIHAFAGAEVSALLPEPIFASIFRRGIATGSAMFAERAFPAQNSLGQGAVA
jgi:hypothetical protein